MEVMPNGVLKHILKDIPKGYTKGYTKGSTDVHAERCTKGYT